MFSDFFSFSNFHKKCHQMKNIQMIVSLITTCYVTYIYVGVYLSQKPLKQMLRLKLTFFYNMSFVPVFLYQFDLLYISKYFKSRHVILKSVSYIIVLAIESDLRSFYRLPFFLEQHK